MYTSDICLLQFYVISDDDAIRTNWVEPFNPDLAYIGGVVVNSDVIRHNVICHHTGKCAGRSDGTVAT